MRNKIRVDYSILASDYSNASCAYVEQVNHSSICTGFYTYTDLSFITKDDSFYNTVAIFKVRKRSEREIAIAWWKTISEDSKKLLCKDWLPSFVNHCFVTGLQIEILYEKAIGETH